MARLLNKVANGFKPRDRHTNAKNFKKKYKLHQKNLKKIFESIDHIAITSDLWLNKGLEHFLVLTPHFFDSKFNYVSLVIGFSKFEGRHFAKRIKPLIKNELELLRISEKIIAIKTESLVLRIT